MRKLILLFFFLTSLNVYSQSPDWSVNVYNYQYSMTFTIFLNVNGNTLTNSNDKVGAFVNDENRGEATVVFNANADKYVAYLTVYGNVGETINFKIYDSQNNQIITTSQSHSFIINGNVGGVFQSFSVANPVLATDAIITSFSLKDVASQSSIIDNKIIITVNNDVDLTNLSPVFTTVNNGKVYDKNQKIVSGLSVLNFSNLVALDVLSEDESVLKTYEVTVQKDNNQTQINATLTSENQNFNSNPVAVFLNFSEAVNNLEATFFDVTNCLVSKVSSTNNINFSIEIIPLSEGSFSIQLKENTVTGQDNQTNKVSNILELVSDTKKPFIKSIQRSFDSNESSAENSLVFDIAFNEPVVGVSIDDFYATENSILSIKKNSDSNYELTVSNLANYEGVVSVSILQNSNITDFAGNVLQTSKVLSYEKK